MSAVAEHLEHAAHGAHEAAKGAAGHVHHHAGKAAHGAGNIFRKQLGPLPVGGWLAVVVAGIGLGLVAKKKLAPADTGAAPVADATDAAADPGGLSSPGLPAGYYEPGTTAPPATPPSAPTPTTTRPIIFPRPVTPLPVPTRPAVPVVTKPAPPPLPRPAPAPVKPSQPATHHYTIASGDTLSKIAARFHTTAAHLYALNHAVLDAAAKKHGHASSENGRYIYPGTVIVVP